MLRVYLNGRDYGEEVLTDPLAIQLPVTLFRTRNAMFEGVQLVGSAPIKPENWASPVELSAIGPVLKIKFGPEGAMMQIIVPTIGSNPLGTVPIELPPLSTSPCT
jgi:hypothetical protein